MAVSEVTAAPARGVGGGAPPPGAARGRAAPGARRLRALVVSRKDLRVFVLRTLIQPFLLCFVFLYVFPKIGQGIGGDGPVPQSAFRKIPVPGGVGISAVFHGVL